MGLLGQAFARGLSWPQLSNTDERVWTSYAPLTRAGVGMDANRAMTIAAVWAAVMIISETVGMLPLHIYRRRPDGGRERAPDHPLEVVLSQRPNQHQDAMQWREMLQSHIELRGNAYCEIMPGPLGAVDQLIPLHPDCVQVEQEDDGSLIYRVTGPNGAKRVLLEDEVFHLTGLSFDGICGLSPIAYARESFGTTAATEEYGARLFGHGTLVGSILKHPGRLTDEAATRIKADIEAVTSGLHNAHRTVVLEEGMEFQRMGLTNEDAQFLETRQFQIREIARWFRIPPHMIGDLEDATYSNIEHQALEFVKYTIQPRVTRWEKAIGKQLILRDDVYYAEFTLDGLLRGDTLSRFQAYAIAINNMFMNPNEVRARENLNPYEGGDEFYQPLNMSPVGADPNEIAQAAANYLEIWSRMPSFRERVDRIQDAIMTNGHSNGRH